MIRKQDYQTQVVDIKSFEEFAEFITTKLTCLTIGSVKNMMVFEAIGMVNK